MNDSENSPGRSIKMILGTLGIFVVFGFLALILSGFAGNESAEDRAFKGEFSEETIKVRWANLEEIEKAQSEAFDQTKVDAALKQIGSTTSKPPAKTDIVVPGSPTFLKQAEQQPAPASEEAPTAEEEPTAKEAPAADEKADQQKEEAKDPGPVIKPAAPGAAAPEKETPKPGPVNSPEPDEKPKGDAKPKGDSKAKDDSKPEGDSKAKAKAPEQPAPAPADQ